MLELLWAFTPLFFFVSDVSLMTNSSATSLLVPVCSITTLWPQWAWLTCSYTSCAYRASSGEKLLSIERYTADENSAATPTSCFTLLSSKINSDRRKTFLPNSNAFPSCSYCWLNNTTCIADKCARFTLSAWCPSMRRAGEASPPVRYTMIVYFDTWCRAASK
eukprot:Mycagemm_TRINITY_DN10107_c0_g3::TRINITY_DN10107_c0_g3_i1::g.5090::m.5090 type:complete len:163 gc:universal TRINITY_DN10107_c0_g3_i1:714-226(-)